MNKLLIFPALLFSLLAAGQPGWRQGLRYRMDVNWNDRQQTLDGKMDLLYRNNSPDTLHFIWFHIWPNAYRNDKTSYSEQLLENGKTRFYFSARENRGYINRLEFRMDGTVAAVADHPEFQDVIKLILPRALNPGDSVLIAAAFHVQLPLNFSGTGHQGSGDQVSNWYPEPAVYDRKGWHPMPYLEQGGAYHEAADYDVRIGAPAGYTVAAGSAPDSLWPGPNGRLYRHFSMAGANAFAWVADKRLLEKDDSVLLDGGKPVGLHLFYFPGDQALMETQLGRAKSLVREISRLVGPYPYPSLSIVETRRFQEQGFSGLLQLDLPSLKSNPDALEQALLSQWFQTVLLSDERQEPWLSKGFVDYYTRRLKPQTTGQQPAAFRKDERLWLRVAGKEKTAQPIASASTDLSPDNYTLIAGTKAGLWIKTLEDSVGQQPFDRLMQAYFNRWSFGHPYAEDLQTMAGRISGKPLDGLFEKINLRGPVLPPEKRPYRPAFLFSAAASDKFRYLNLSPVAGYNRYDQFMPGILIHNINLPQNNFEFLLMPLYATGSQTIQGLGRIRYSWYPEKTFRKISLGLNGSRFSVNYATDSTGSRLFENFAKLVPYLRFDFKKQSPRSTISKWMDFKSYLIREKEFSDYRLSSKDSLLHPNSLSAGFRYLNQWSLNLRDERVLYPYDARLELQQSELFYRANLTAHYFFNYPSGGGLTVRFFAAKFGVWHANNRQDLSRYEPKLLGNTGEEDYAYDQYFAGRSSSYALENTSLSNDGLAAQQIMIRDGGLKLRLDAYPYVQGLTRDWLTALNFSTTLPEKLFPFPVPLRLFFDFGTYAEAWQSGAGTSRFLYTGGIQLSLFRNILNIYAPLVYSSDFRNLLKTEGFGKRITFSIDIRQVNPKSRLEKALSNEFRD